MRYVWKIGCESEITQLNKRHHYRRMEDERRRSLSTFSYLKFHHSERCVYLYYIVLICSLKTPDTSEQWRSVTLLNSLKLYFGYTLLAIETKPKKKNMQAQESSCTQNVYINWIFQYGLVCLLHQHNLVRLSKFSMFILWVKHEIQILTYQPGLSVET